MRIEYLLRQGQRKLDLMRDPHITGMGHFVSDGKEWKKTTKT